MPCRALSLVLALILALVSQQTAALRAVPGLTITLCTGEGAVTVTLDASGKPVVPGPHCPACLPALSPPPAAAPVLIARALRPAPPAPPVPLAPGTPRRPLPPARAPPLPA